MKKATFTSHIKQDLIIYIDYQKKSIKSKGCFQTDLQCYIVLFIIIRYISRYQ